MFNNLFKKNISFKNNIVNKNNYVFKKNININKGLNFKNRTKSGINNFNKRGTNLNKNKKNFRLIQTQNILKYNDEELNSLPYQKALFYDKRGFCLYYLSLLKKGNIFLFAFYCNKKDYNSQFIKIFLFFFFFTLYLTINALFFNDNTMHKIYIDEGKFDYFYHIPQIIYSNLISFVITLIIEFLALSESNIIDFKQEKNINILNKKFEKLLYKLKIKFALFFVISFLFSIVLGYYMSCFCGIYVNTQIHLITDSLISFGLSLLYPFIIYLFPGMLRICALRAKKKDKNCLYRFSQIIQKI